MTQAVSAHGGQLRRPSRVTFLPPIIFLIMACVGDTFGRPRAFAKISLPFRSRCTRWLALIYLPRRAFLRTQLHLPAHLPARFARSLAHGPYRKGHDPIPRRVI